MKIYYETLGLSSNASVHEIRQKFRELAKRFHPDHNPNDPNAEENFKKVAAAYAILIGKADRSYVQDGATDRQEDPAWVLWAFSPMNLWARMWADYLKAVVAG